MIKGDMQVLFQRPLSLQFLWRQVWPEVKLNPIADAYLLILLRDFRIIDQQIAGQQLKRLHEKLGSIVGKRFMPLEELQILRLVAAVHHDLKCNQAVQLRQPVFLLVIAVQRLNHE